MAREPTPVQAVLFDALGTLLSFDDPAPALRAALRRRTGRDVTEAAAAAAMRAEIAYYRAHLHEGRDEASVAELRRRCGGVVRAALALDGVPEEEVTAALLEAIAFRAFPDAAPVLGALRGRGVRLGVVSNWDAGLPEVLARVGLEGFEVVVTSAREGVAKPRPGPFRRALARLAVPAAAALHVGDSPQEDVAGARAAGVRPVLISRASARNPPAGDADVPVIATLDGLLALIA